MYHSTHTNYFKTSIPFKYWLLLISAILKHTKKKKETHKSLKYDYKWFSISQ